MPARLQDQMLAHLSLKFRTDSEGLQQKETLDSLPKAIRSSISHFLFYSLVDKVYLFRGVSNDLLFQLVIGKDPSLLPVISLSFEHVPLCWVFYVLHFEGFGDESRVFPPQRRCDLAE